jgi:hypothetical protein
MVCAAETAPAKSPLGGQPGNLLPHNDLLRRASREGRSYGGTMDKKLAGLVGAAAALTTMSAAQAAPAVGPELPQVTSYRDLLDPIPNALPLLKADDQRLAPAARGSPRL